MKKIYIGIMAIAIIGLFISGGCVKPAPSEQNQNYICCHSFGYGSMMKRCCDEYEWKLPEECKIPEGFVGGGKEIVADSYCKSTMTLPITARGDFADPGPIEDECKKRMEQYIQSSEFNNKGFSKCDLTESKVGFSEKECPNGFSPQGCSICRLKCE